MLFLVVCLASSAAKERLKVKGLGIRVNKVKFLNEKDSTKVVLKGWQDFEVWCEIHDILGFKVSIGYLIAKTVVG